MSTSLSEHERVASLFLDGAAKVDSDMVGDRFVEQSVALLRSRSRAGQAKYGVTLERTDLTLGQWLTHLEEELADALNYVQRLRSLLPPWLRDTTPGDSPCPSPAPPPSPPPNTPSSSSSPPA